MLRAIIALAFLASPAFAQQIPPTLPIEITADELRELDKYLGDQPHRVVAPLVNFLANKQRLAQEAAAKKAAETKDAPK